MARRTTLVRLLDMLRHEIGGSINPAHNSSARDKQVHALQVAQQALWEDFEWPHLRVERFVQLRLGERFYDLDTGTTLDLPIDNIEQIEVKWGGDWLPVKFGIGAEQYSLWDSEAGEQSWPVERWRVYEDEQIEVWPVPDQDGTESDKEGYLKFTGIRKLSKLIDDDDRCDLDDRLITLRAATENFLTGDKLKMKVDAYKTLLARVRGNMTPNVTFRMYGRKDMTERQLRGPPRVHYRVNET